jgi:quercetin dioxygenase-like cupin family protein
VKVIKYLDVKPVQELPGVLKREVITAADGAPNFCMRVFQIDPGVSTHSHSHEWEHEVFILSGRGTVVHNSTKTPIGKDSVVFLAPNEHHCLINNGKTPLRFVCLIPNATKSTTCSI